MDRVLLLRYLLIFFPFYNFCNSHESRGARPFVVTTMHEPFKAHPKAAHHHCCHRCLKRPIVVIARDTAAEEAVGPTIDGACTVKEVKGGVVLLAAEVAAVVKAIVRAVVPHQNHPSHEMRSGQEKRVLTKFVSL
jgi:hypothetical protein